MSISFDGYAEESNGKENNGAKKKKKKKEILRLTSAALGCKDPNTYVQVCSFFCYFWSSRTTTDPFSEPI